jgi:two-component system, NarL family, response regulator LiaR
MNPTSRPIRVLIADDHDMLREGLQTFIRSFNDLQLVGEAATGIEAIQRCQELHPDVVLMDLVMPEMDGTVAIQKIHQAQPEIRIIVLSSFGEDHMVKTALRNGATSYLLKNITASKLAEAIRAAVSGLPILSPEVAQALIQANSEPLTPRQYELTPRELDVLELMASGKSNSDISETLCISIFTVKNHVSSILSKLGVTSRTEAVSLALKNKLVTGE